jgi:hypothetical protein
LWPCLWQIDVSAKDAAQFIDFRGLICGYPYEILLTCA